MPKFQAITTSVLVDHIRQAKHRVVFASPGLSGKVAEALVAAHRNSRNITVIFDPHEDTCRIGYGDTAGLQYLQEHARGMQLREHAGLRLGLLVADDDVAVWSPPPQSVDDGDDKRPQANGVILEGSAVPHGNEHCENKKNEADSTDSQTQRPEASSAEAHPEEKAPTKTLADDLLESMENDHIGDQKLQSDSLKPIVDALKENPPAPFDLSRKVRVFSTKFQYVEAELQGAEWIRKKIKVSSLLLNSDLPENLEEILETQVRPYHGRAAVAIKIPIMVEGQIAYNQHGEAILRSTTQHELESTWKEIKERYLFRVPEFGVLIRKPALRAFRAEVEQFEFLLRAWVDQFRQFTQRHEDELVLDIVSSIRRRLDNSVRRQKLAGIDLKREVRRGLARMRVKEPRVRIVVKDVSWQSSRDRDFTNALRKALPPNELQGWFDEFTAVHERD